MNFLTFDDIGFILIFGSIMGLIFHPRAGFFIQLAMLVGIIIARRSGLLP